MKLSHLLGFLAIAGLIGSCVSQQQYYNQCDTAGEDLQRCQQDLTKKADLLTLMNLARDEASLDDFCRSIDSFKSCVLRILKDCAHKMGDTNDVKFVLQKTVETTENLCNLRSDLRRDYLRYVAGDCSDKVNPKLYECTRKYSSLSNEISQPMPTPSPEMQNDRNEIMKYIEEMNKLAKERAKKGCCVADLARHCTKSYAKEMCSNEAYNVVMQIIDRETAAMEDIESLAGVSCRAPDYQHDSQYCEAFASGDASKTAAGTLALIAGFLVVTVISNHVTKSF